jgi:hypothetical protein
LINNDKVGIARAKGIRGIARRLREFIKEEAGERLKHQVEQLVKENARLKTGDGGDLEMSKVATLKAKVLKELQAKEASNRIIFEEQMRQEMVRRDEEWRRREKDSQRREEKLRKEFENLSRQFKTLSQRLE